MEESNLTLNSYSSENNKENKNNNTNNKSLIRTIFYYLLIIIGLFILYFIEKLVFLIVNFIIRNSFLSKLTVIFLNLLLIRYVIHQVIFIGSSFILSRYIRYGIGKREAMYVLKEIKCLKNSLLVYIDKSHELTEYKDLLNVYLNVKSAFSLINCEYKTFQKMKDKYNSLTKDQNEFLINVTNLNNNIEKSKIIQTLNSIITILKKNKFHNINEIFQIDLKNFYDTKKDNEKYINTILMTINLIQDQLIDFLGDDYKLFYPRFIRNFFFNELFGSLEQYHIELESYFDFEEKKLKTKDNHEIDYIIISKPTNNQNNNIKKSIMIICGPNGNSYQFFMRNINIKNYFKEGVDILCWSYRGYGFSSGKVNFKNIKSDVLEIYNEVEKMNIYNNIGVHGISIGGVPACYLASQKNKIKLLISDRNFGQLENIVKGYIFGRFLFYFYKIFFFPSSRNLENYLNSNAFKIILNDPNDEIVLEEGSLKTLISEDLCKKYLTIIDNEDSDEISNESSIELTNIESTTTSNEYITQTSTIDLLRNKKNRINQNLNNKFNDYQKNNNKNYTALDIILGHNKNKFIQMLLDINKAFNDKNLDKDNNKLSKKIKNIFVKIKKNENYSYLKEEELRNLSGIFEFIKKSINYCFLKFESSGDSLLRLQTIKGEYRQKLFIENFFNNLFIWGTYDKKDDFGCVYFSTEHIDDMLFRQINILNDFYNSSEIAGCKKLKIMKDIDLYREFIIKIKQNIKYVALKNDGVFTLLKNGKEYEKGLIKLGRGNLVGLHCGHNGILKVQENMVFKKYIIESKYLYSEKNINNNQMNIIDTSVVNNDSYDEDDEDFNMLNN